MAAPSTTSDSYSVDAGAILTVGYPSPTYTGGGGGNTGGGDGGDPPPQGTQTPEGVTIQTYTLENISGGENTIIASHGLACAKGDYPSGTYPLAVIGGTETNTQCNILATWNDGSIRHCKVHYAMGTTPDNGQKTVVFDRTSVQPLGSNVDAVDFPNFDVGLSTTIDSIGWTIDVTDVQVTGVTRYNGPLCQEIVYSGEFRQTNDINTTHPHLRGIFYVKFYSDGFYVTDFVLENCKSWSSGIQKYDVPTGVTLLVRMLDGFNKGANVNFIGSTIPARTRHYLGSYTNDSTLGTSHELAVMPDSAYLKANAFVPNYTTSTVSEASISAQHTTFLANNTPGDIGLAQADMGATGAAPDIGPLPEWQARFITTPDSRLFQDLVGTSHLAGSWRIHYRDETNGNVPFRISDWDRVSTSWFSVPSLPGTGGNGTGDQGYSPDDAHQPQFSYLPYLLTGDLYHLEELQFWAAWNVMELDPQSRNAVTGSGADGVFTKSQQRGMAWSLRTLEYAAFITPDSDPNKANLENQFEQNIEWITRTRVEDYSKSPLGHIYTLLHQEDGGNDNNSLRPWMSDFWAMIFLDIWKRNEDDARFERIADWASKWQSRAMDPDFCLAHAGNYSYVMDPDLDGQWFTSFNEILAENYPSSVGNCPSTLSGSSYANPQSYPAQLYGALSLSVEVGRSGAVTARNNIITAIDSNGANIQNAPNFYISPRNTPTTHPLSNLTPGQWVNGNSFFSNWWDDVYTPVATGNQSLDGLFRFSGGAFDTFGNRYIHVGGGHNDSANNQILAMNFNTMSFEALTSPTSPVTPTSQHALFDGAPASRHTYAGCAVLGRPYNQLYIAGGSPYPDAGGYAGFFSMELDTNTWNPELNAPNGASGGGGFGGLMCHNPRTQDLYIVNNSGLSKYNPITGLHEFRSSYYNGFDGYSAMDYNPLTDKILIYGGTGDRTGLARGHVIDLSNGFSNATDAAGSWTGDTSIFNGNKGGVFFHPRLRKFIAFNNDISTTSLFSIDETTQVVEEIPMGGVSPTVPDPNWAYGLWRRIFYIPDFDVIGLIPTSGDVFFCKVDY